ncbi:hypothetical protein [Turicibacter sp. TJ11]|uniref:hypothetical protein n=1 Tax=Turicibacter sp. TJ11 TaxID=2806443 RepID=UPI001F356EBF|nr:hypothetical protein [Turicibacter sp. TJ11]
MASVMSFKREEMETVAIFEYQTNSWTICSNVPNHMTQMKKKIDEDKIEVMCVDKNGRPTQLMAKGIKKLVTFRNTKEGE